MSALDIQVAPSIRQLIRINTLTQNLRRDGGLIRCKVVEYVDRQFLLLQRDVFRWSGVDPSGIHRS